MRVIAGSARGIPLKAPAGMDTRPTVDKVKEAVFGALQFFLPGSRVLDLFAGSGALGIEALSRGAAAAVLVEKQAAAFPAGTKPSRERTSPRSPVKRKGEYVFRPAATEKPAGRQTGHTGAEKKGAR